MSKEFAFVTGLGIGEETKGATVEWLAKKLNAHTVTRSGGCQGGAHVVLRNGREQMFSHFGAGTFDGIRTHLLHMVVNPADLFTEGIELENKGIADPFSLITIDNQCLTLTPYHSAIDRLREILRGSNKKGTVGKGVGDAIRDSHNSKISIRAGEFVDSREKLKEKVETIRQYKLSQAHDLICPRVITDLSEDAQQELNLLYNRELVGMTVDSYKALASIVKIVDQDFLEDLLCKDGAIVNETSHGALLHPWYGFVPHVTQIDPISQDVLSTLKAHDYNGKVLRFGVSRCYMTRHGAGPLVSFNPDMTNKFHETHNDRPEDNAWIGEFRNGNYDLVAMKYALEICGGSKSFDGLIISYLDQLAKFDEWQVCVAYQYEGKKDVLSDFFNIEDGLISGIKVHPNTKDATHLQHQIQLTQLLKQCRPVLTTLKPEDGKSLEEVFIKFIEENLHVPVVVTAYGPHASDRSVRPGKESLFTTVI